MNADAKNIEHAASLQKAAKIAQDCLDRRITPLQAARDLLRNVGIDHPAWHALGGGYGPLSALYVAADEADRLHWLGDDVERWHPSVREQKRAEVAAAEAAAMPDMHAACRALIEYARRSAAEK